MNEDHEAERQERRMAARYAPPGSAAASPTRPPAVGVAGWALYLAFAAMLTASALERVPLGGSGPACTTLLGGIAGAYTWGRRGRHRGAGFVIGLLVTFVVIALAIWARHQA